MAATSRRRPPRWYEIEDPYPLPGDRRVIGVVRYDGDRATWDRLLADFLRCAGWPGEDPTALVEEPEVRWYRINPDYTGEYGWLLGEASGPGRGNWQGAKVVLR